jgi:hypothetical protein
MSIWGIHNWAVGGLLFAKGKRAAAEIIFKHYSYP